jgi:pimeloyl-ACP methyl ester carboxylesterase
VAGPCTHQRRAGAGEPLVAIHGIGSSWLVWNPILPSLEARHDVLSVSLPGYGESPPLEQEPTVPALCDAVEREMDAAGMETAHLVGNSLGGWIVAELARRGRARSAVALSPAGLWTRKELAYSVASLERSYALTRAIAPFAALLTRSRVLRTVVFAQVSARGWKMPPEDAAYAMRALAGSPSFRRTRDWIVANQAMPEGLDEIPCPFLVAWGTWDFLLPVRQAARWARLVPGAELRELPRLGHLPMVDDPERTAELILDFTARHGEREAREQVAEPAAG